APAIVLAFGFVIRGSCSFDCSTYFSAIDLLTDRPAHRSICYRLDERPRALFRASAGRASLKHVHAVCNVEPRRACEPGQGPRVTGTTPEVIFLGVIFLADSR